MKKVLTLILTILIVVGCKKDKEREEPKVEYENWQTLPDSVIKFGYRNIIATEKVGERLYVQARNAHYMLDSGLVLKKDNSYMFPFEIAPYFSLQEGLKHNNNYMIHPVDKIGLKIVDAQQFWSEQVSYNLLVNNLVDSFNDYRNGFGWSGITENNEFDIVIAENKKDTSYFWLITFTINHTPGAFRKIEVIENGRFLIKKAIDMNMHHLRSRIYVCRIRDQRFVFSYSLGELYRFSDNNLIDSHKYLITNIFEHNEKLYAGTLSAQYFDTSITRKDGLLYSTNNGANWEYANLGLGTGSFNKKSLGNYIVIQATRTITILDLEKNEEKKVDLTGLNGQINSIEKFYDKIVVGTDAGVFYKSWESFLKK